MRQGDLAFPRARDAGLGADRGPRARRVRSMGQFEAPGPGIALLMSTPPNSSTLRLTEELIARASVSPVDGGCQALMIERLAGIGFSVGQLQIGPGEDF